MVNVKFCGLKRLCDIAWVNELHPEYAGFVFAGKKRRVDDKQAALLRRALDPAIAAVGVFVNEAPAHIEALVLAGTIQIVQLHGQEDEAYIAALRQHLRVPIIKAFSIACAADIVQAQHSTADYILLDHGAGGTGEPFNWAWLSSIKRPYFLAGGLSPDNAAQAAALQPYALDVSSGIETDGVKDKEKMISFMAQIRAYRR